MDSIIKNYIHSTNFCSFKKFIFIEQNHIIRSRKMYSFKNSGFLARPSRSSLFNKSSSQTLWPNAFNKLARHYPSWFEIPTHHSPPPFVPKWHTGNSCSWIVSSSTLALPDLFFYWPEYAVALFVFRARGISIGGAKLLVFCVTPFKIDPNKDENRLWEMKEGKYAKTLAKIQVRGIFRIRDIRGNILPKLIEICMETACCCSPGWAPTWRTDPNKNICYRVLLQKREFILREIHKH